MKVIFNVDYRTRPGQDIFLVLGGETIPMNCSDGGGWSLEIPDCELTALEYNYIVRESGSTLYEVGRPRWSAVDASVEELVLNDSWQGFDDNAPFLTAPFADVFNLHKVSSLKYGKHSREVVIRVTAPLTASDETICISGNIPELGGWNVERALPLKYAGGCRWEISLKRIPEFEYKFIRRSSDGCEWESGENRRAVIPEMPSHSVYLLEHSCAAFRPEKPRMAGTAVPVFSLRSRKDYGVGDFLDIKLLVKWAVATGQKVIQLLPVNDTTSTGTWTDSYPYSGISIMALHPLYLNLQDVGIISDADARMEFEKRRREINGLDKVDYEMALKLKLDYASRIYAESGEKVLESEEYREFFRKNREWLLPYSAFCYLRDRFGTADFHNWGEWEKYDCVKVAGLWDSIDAGPDMKFHCFIQFYLDRQLREARNFSHAHGVILKGDIPIGITANSVEAWTEPHYFNMDSQAGAPPDYFSTDGQNWGFPTYNWERMEEDDYLWWRKRFAKMSEYFDAYRIDHVLGFFRIWEIPRPFKSGKMGHFAPSLPYPESELKGRGMDMDLFLEDPHRPGYYHPRIDSRGKGGEEMDRLYDDFFFFRHNGFWKAGARKKLPALIAATGMLACAEDLGMIPPCVPEVLSDLKILTLEIQRMQKDPGVGLGNPSSYPYLSVCSTGSHDTSTLRGWYRETHGDRDCDPESCRRIISEHLHSPSMLAVLPIQDWTSIDGDVRVKDTCAERINDPSNPNHYWRYRMHLDLEDLLKMSGFNARILEMVKFSGR